MERFMNSVKLRENVFTYKPSATLAINEKVKKLRSKGQTISHFGFGQSPFPMPPQIVEALKNAAENKHYLPGEGLPELRIAISDYYQKQFNYPFSEQEVFIAPGSKESLFHLLYLLEGPLLLPAPSWVSYAPQAGLLEKEVHYLQTSYEQNYHLTPFVLEQALKYCAKEEQKVLILNSPNNPTGLTYNQVELDALAKVCAQYNVVVISDEIYGGTEFYKQSLASMVYAYPEKTIVTAGLSKLFSAGGYRLGFSLIPKEMNQLKKALTILISETYSCVAAPVQYAALAAYAHFDEIAPYLAACNLRHRWAGTYLAEQFQAMGLRCHVPQGAFYVMPDFSPLAEPLAQANIKTDADLCTYLLRHHHVACLPGSDFGMKPESLSVRVASVDYNGESALLASNINEACFSSLHFGIKQISDFVQALITAESLS